MISSVVSHFPLVVSLSVISLVANVVVSTSIGFIGGNVSTSGGNVAAIVVTITVASVAGIAVGSGSSGGNVSTSGGIVTGVATLVVAMVVASVVGIGIGSGGSGVLAVVTLFRGRGVIVVSVIGGVFEIVSLVSVVI